MPTKLSTRGRSRPSSVFLVNQLYVQDSSIRHVDYFGQTLIELGRSQITQICGRVWRISQSLWEGVLWRRGWEGQEERAREVKAFIPLHL